MTTPEQEPSGIDLARQVLADYKARTWAVPTGAPPRSKKKPRKFVRGADRRDPVALADAFAGLGVDLQMDSGLAGGSILDQWSSLCPQYADCVQPVSYDQHTGRLDVRPGTHAYAAQLRILGGQLAKQINDKMGRTVVRSIRVLPVGNFTPDAHPTTPPTDAQPPAGPVKTRETASPGYRSALEAARSNRPERTISDPYLAEAMRRQEAALRASRQPEPVVDLEAAAARQVDRSEAVRRAALARKRQEQAGGEPRRLFGAA
ncbi:DciA family protein [Streptomyces collinus]|uniref:DciA family protein n=1 Tax=Streptomyces collinus TaxID=42684 RepID=UPI0033A63928